MNAETATQKLNDAVQQMAFRGRQVRPDFWGVDRAFAPTGNVCICGALLAAVGAVPENGYKTGAAILAAVAKHLGITVGRAAALNNGFEGLPFTARKTRGAKSIVPARDRTWYSIGKAFRRRWEKANKK